MTRDELIAIIQEYDIGQEYEAELADRILALLPPKRCRSSVARWSTIARGPS